MKTVGLICILFASFVILKLFAGGVGIMFPIEHALALSMGVLPILLSVLLLVLGIKLAVAFFTACSRQIDKVSEPSRCQGPQSPVWNAGSEQAGSAGPNVNEAELMRDLSRTAERLSKRLESLEVILDDDHAKK